MSNLNVDNNVDNNDDAIRAKLLGLEIENGSINYGIVSNFKYEFTGYETIMIALTDKGNEIEETSLISKDTYKYDDMGNQIEWNSYKKK